MPYITGDLQRIRAKTRLEAQEKGQWQTVPITVIRAMKLGMGWPDTGVLISP